jgi:hypothetical protein
MNIYVNGYQDEIDTFGNDGMSCQIPKDKIDSELEARRKKFNIKYKNISLYLKLSVFGTLIWAYAGFINLNKLNLCC